MINVLAIGDSLTHFGFQENGWATLIHRSNSHIKLQNIGIHSITSSELVKSLPSLITSDQIIHAQIATLFLGTNDTLHYYKKPVSPSQFSNNICTIVYYLKSINPFLRIILIGPPITTFSINKYITEEKSLIYQVNQVISTLAKQLNVVFVDLMDNTDGNKILLEDLHDGIHMNDSGHIKMAAKIGKHLY